MKSSVVDFHKGKQELVSMDDELPLIIFILVHTTPEFLYSDIHFVEDFIKLETSLESEKRLMVNIKVILPFFVFNIFADSRINMYRFQLNIL